MITLSDRQSESGWVKPQRSLTLQELQVLIATKKAELADLERQAATLIADAKLEACVKIRNIMRAHQLSIEDIA